MTFKYSSFFGSKMRATLMVAAILTAAGMSEVDSSVLVADLAMTRMVELNAGAPFCALYHDRGTIQRMVLGSDPKKVRQISNNLVADLEETCKASRRKGKVYTFIFPFFLTSFLLSFDLCRFRRFFCLFGCSCDCFFIGLHNNCASRVKVRMLKRRYYYTKFQILIFAYKCV